MLKISSSCLLIFLAALVYVQANPVTDELIPQKFEGDMLLSPALQRLIKAGNETTAGKRSRRNALIDGRARWPGGVVYYYIAKGFSGWEQNMIKEAMHHISSQTCVKFRLYNYNAQCYVYIRPGYGGCYADVGYERGRAHILNLIPFNYQSGHCFEKGIIVHELLHVLGIFHQQSASNRDQYLHVLQQNIQQKNMHNFDKYPNTMVTDFSLGYDYSSIMHYGLYAFSKNGRRTMQPTRYVDERVIGQRERLSSKDVVKINQMYNCY